MSHVVTRPTAPFRTSSGSLEIHQVPSAQDNLVWIAVCTQTGEAAAIDGPEADTTLAYCRQHGIRWTTILNTHTHPDHIGINRDLQQRHMLRNMRVVGATARATDVPGITQEVGEGDTVQVGDAQGTVWVTEGHIDGHISFLFDDVLFCGDTLFTGGCGYLFDGPPAKMHRSLTRLAQLERATRVCCGHEYTQDNLRFAWMVEPDNRALAGRIQAVWAMRSLGAATVPSTIGEERATNPFLRCREASIRWHVGEAFPGTDLDDSLAVFTALRAWKDRKDHRAIPDEELPL